MSLEASLTRNNELLEKLVSQNERILGIAESRAANGAAASSGETEAKGKGSRSSKKDDKNKDDGGISALTKADLTKGLAAWLNEYGKADEGHPESVARHAALKTVLGKLELENLKVLADDDQVRIDKLGNWLENTAKKADKGFGIGRLAADPAPEDVGDGDDDLGV